MWPELLNKIATLSAQDDDIGQLLAALRAFVHSPLAEALVRASGNKIDDSVLLVARLMLPLPSVI